MSRNLSLLATGSFRSSGFRGGSSSGLILLRGLGLSWLSRGGGLLLGCGLNVVKTSQ